MNLRDEYIQYREFTEQELNVKDAVITKQNEIIQKMYTELRASKVMIEIPRLREKLSR